LAPWTLQVIEKILACTYIRTPDSPAPSLADIPATLGSGWA